jgi:HAD superfamily hydrolase (TIGR01509 family)
MNANIYNDFLLEQSVIKVIYFDLGGVVVTDGFKRAAPLFEKELQIPQEKLYAAYLKTDDIKYAMGKIEKERWQHFFKELNVKADVEKYIALWHSIFVPVPEIVELIKILSKKYTLGVLSDQPKDILPYFQQLGIFDLFSLRIISSEVGHSKSEKNLIIYEFAITQAQVAPDEMLFIDDVLQNVDNAARFGINTIHYENPAQLRKRLVQLGIKL